MEKESSCISSSKDIPPSCNLRVLSTGAFRPIAGAGAEFRLHALSEDLPTLDAGCWLLVGLKTGGPGLRCRWMRADVFGRNKHRGPRYGAPSVGCRSSSLRRSRDWPAAVQSWTGTSRTFVGVYGRAFSRARFPVLSGRIPCLALEFVKERRDGVGCRLGMEASTGARYVRPNRFLQSFACPGPCRCRCSCIY